MNQALMKLLARGKGGGKEMLKKIGLLEDPVIKGSMSGLKGRPDTIERAVKARDMNNAAVRGRRQGLGAGLGAGGAAGLGAGYAMGGEDDDEGMNIESLLEMLGIGG